MRIAFIVLLALLPLRAEDWITTDGKTYKDVTVIKVEDDAVTILDSDGGARVPLKTLNASLQKKFHYDPVKAAIAADKFAKEDEAERLAVEEQQDHPPQVIPQAAPSALPSSSSPPPTPAKAIAQAAPQTPSSALTEDQRASIEAQIKSLQDDVAFMQREIDKESSDGHQLKTDGRTITHGGYADKIADEKNQISQLQQQLK
jgi:hypothetical protein